MKEPSQSLLANIDEQGESNPNQTLIMGGTLVLINLFLMLSLGIYWINPSVQLYFSGRPL